MSTAKLVPTTPPKLNGNYEDPETLLIVGLDTFPKGLDVADYEQFSDPRRIRLPPKEGLIESIMQHGVNDPITCFSVKATTGDRYRIVVNGRQRVLAAREANKRMRALGGDHFVSVPYVTKNDSDAVTVVVSNEYHTRQTPIDRAEKAARLLKWGKTKAQVRAAFEADDGKMISQQTLDNYLSLLKLKSADKDRLERGELSLTEAYAIAKGKVAPVIDDEPRPRATSTRALSKRPAARVLAALAETYAPTETEPHETEADALTHALMVWVSCGDATLLDRWPSVREQIDRVVQPSFVKSEEEL